MGSKFSWLCSQFSVYKFMFSLGWATLRFSKLPSHTTIRNWACKMGYYRVHQEVALSEEKWLILIDKSISLGNEKILLILGMPLSLVSFDKALNLSDLRVLAMEIRKTWSEADII